MIIGAVLVLVRIMYRASRKDYSLRMHIAYDAETKLRRIVAPHHLIQLSPG